MDIFDTGTSQSLIHTQTHQSHDFRPFIPCLIIRSHPLTVTTHTLWTQTFRHKHPQTCPPSHTTQMASTRYGQTQSEKNGYLRSIDPIRRTFPSPSFHIHGHPPTHLSSHSFTRNIMHARFFQRHTQIIDRWRANRQRGAGARTTITQWNHSELRSAPHHRGPAIPPLALPLPPSP